jgi:uncharacterized membrane protein
MNIVNILSGLLITSIFAWIVYQRHLSGQFDLTQDFRAWGKLFLLFMGVSIVARIIIMIVFHILNAIATRETDVPVEDERDKLVKLKSTRNSHYVFAISMFTGILLLAIGMPVYVLFIVFVIGGLISEIVDNGSQIYYYRKGV